MEIMTEDSNINISNIIESTSYIIKQYTNKYNFVDQIVLNEIGINKKLHDLGIKFIPSLVLVEKGINNTNLYFEKIEGRNLSTIKFEYISFEEKFSILLKILNIVKILHLNNISHNDLTLSNIIITDNKEVFLIDFALSTSLDKKNYINDIMSLNSIINKLFKVKIELKVDNIHRYIKKIGEIKYELLYQRGIAYKKL